MAPTKVPLLWVPFSVLNAPDHSASTRLIWMLLRRYRSLSLTDKRLGRLSGLDLKTVALARSRLALAPLAPCYRHAQPACAAIPMALLAGSGLSAGARLFYGQLQAVPDFKHPGGIFTYAALSRLTGTCAHALRRAAAELAAAGWLRITQQNRKSPLRFTLCNPEATRLSARVSSVRRRVKGAEYRGEALLREFLNVLVDLDDGKENDAPDFLLNPYTRELMELDRFYPGAGVAFEFNGDQHYEETDLATFDATVRQVGRDAMKAFICRARGIELVICHAEDLTLKALEQKIPRRLPRRALDGLEPLVDELERLATEHRERAAEERARRGARQGGAR